MLCLRVQSKIDEKGKKTLGGCNNLTKKKKKRRFAVRREDDLIQKTKLIQNINYYHYFIIYQNPSISFTFIMVKLLSCYSNLLREKK